MRKDKAYNLDQCALFKCKSKKKLFKIIQTTPAKYAELKVALNETLFSSLPQARKQITEWKEDYNNERPHSSLGNITPNEFAMKMVLQNQAA